MHIFEALIKDHEVVKDLLDELVNLDDNDTESRHDLVSSIADELIPHSRAEEAILYNSMRSLKVGEEKVMHSYKEHMEAETLLRSLQVKDRIGLDWKTTARKLKDALEHHIAEEEGQLFALVHQTMTTKETQALGQLFLDMKPKYQEEGFLRNTVEMVANLLPPKSAKTSEQRKAG